MKQSFIATAVTEFFAEDNAQSFTCNGGQKAIDSFKWNIFPDFDQAVEDYNHIVGREVLHVGLLRQQSGEHTWHVCEEDYDMPDAIYSPDIYGAGDNTNVRVIACEDLRDEQDTYLAMADDMEEEDRQAWTARVNDVFGKAIDEMSDLDVLIIGEGLEWHEIAERHPISWTEDATHYRIALVIDSSYNEDTLHNGCLADVADYLNAADNCITDPCEWLRDWCEDNACIYTQDSRYTFRDVDWAYNEREGTVLYTDERGAFAVTDKNIPAPRV